MKCEGEEGYALVAAVASIALFAAMALSVISVARTGIADAGAEQSQLQANAAVDAGVAMALSRLLSDDPAERWSIDGHQYRFAFGEAQIRVQVQDERGKVPLSELTEPVATRLLEAVGLSGDHLLIARDSLLDWTDDDRDARPFGAEAPYYQAAGIVPPNGSLASIGELRIIRGFDAETVERIGQVATTYALPGYFDVRHASPAAIAIMEGSEGKAAIASIARAREAQGQRTAIAFTDAVSLVGRPLTVSVSATLPEGVGATRRIVVQLTGIEAAPYAIIALD